MDCAVLGVRLGKRWILWLVDQSLRIELNIKIWYCTIYGNLFCYVRVYCFGCGYSFWDSRPFYWAFSVYAFFQSVILGWTVCKYNRQKKVKDCGFFNCVFSTGTNHGNHHNPWGLAKCFYFFHWWQVQIFKFVGNTLQGRNVPLIVKVYDVFNFPKAMVWWFGIPFCMLTAQSLIPQYFSLYCMPIYCLIALLYPALPAQITPLSRCFHNDFCRIKILTICFCKLSFGMGHKSNFLLLLTRISALPGCRNPFFLRLASEDYVKKTNESRKLLINVAKRAIYLQWLAELNIKIAERNKVTRKWMNTVKQRAIQEFCVDAWGYLLHRGQKKEILPNAQMDSDVCKCS